jgi:predicted Zn-dependent peptidase
MMAENLGRDFLEKRQDMIKNIKLEDVNRVISQKMSGKNRAIFVVNGKK